ncbi:MAG: alpha/beta fold hydrolase [bacterium]|nr:alpha/beta fold hydrolase [bacterium]
MHYVDEGPRDAPVLLCLHGNPTWSFYWRSLIEAFKGEFRVIVPDHIGCGLSEKPQDWPYTLVTHIQNIERLVETLGLENITLAVHDWGGPIGMGAATRHPERFARLIVTNTAAFPAPGLPASIAMGKLPLLGSFMIRGLNMFARSATVKTTKTRLARDVRRAYLAPYDSYKNRVAIWRFVKDIPTRVSHPSYSTLSDIEVALHRMHDRPMCILWGEKDWVFTPEFRKTWQAHFPAATVHTYDNAGHYVLEDAGATAIEDLRAFFAANPTVPQGQA